MTTWIGHKASGKYTGNDKVIGNDQEVKQGIAVSAAPVILSHSLANAVCNSSRNIHDNILNS